MSTRLSVPLATSGARPWENLATAARRPSFAASALAADDMRAARRKSSGYVAVAVMALATSKGGRTSMALGGGLAFDDVFAADACARQARTKWRRMVAVQQRRLLQRAAAILAAESNHLAYSPSSIFLPLLNRRSRR